MHIDLLKDTCEEGWLHIRLTSGDCLGVPISRANGVTLYAPSEQVDLLSGLSLDYYEDLTGGGFLITSPNWAEGCACGSGFRKHIS